MGFSVIGHQKKKKEADAEKHLRRLHKTVPWIESPLTGTDPKSLVFSQRHEANTAELFFDLFFVANLATFTAYHSITDTSYLFGYIGFFGILWSSWFQVTLHDVRFSRDSIYERVCKTVEFIVFVGLALVGSSFDPGGKKQNNINFRILCYTLVLSRALLAFQYLVVIFFTLRAKYGKLLLPLGLHAAIYTITMIVFIAMTPAFKNTEQTHKSIYSVWYLVMVLEAVGVIIISSSWRMLSFKRTHLMERMSLLTLIVIGEGAIGVTKTVSRMMSKSGLTGESCFLIMCIILILVLIWALYFDNFPHSHYGTIKQQIWSLLHFPFQLAVVGVVEGSQQLALARYVIKHYNEIDEAVVGYCITDHLDGQALQDALKKLISYWKFADKFETLYYNSEITTQLYAIGNTTGICSPQNTTAIAEGTQDWPDEIRGLVQSVFDGVYAGLGMKLPTDKDPIAVAVKSWKLVYIYYWASFIVLILSSIVFLFLIRRHKADIFDWVSVIIRAVAVVFAGVFMALVADEDALYQFVASPFILPVVVIILLVVLFFDRISAVFANWRLRKSGQPYALEHHEEHSQHGHEHTHVPPLHGDVHSEPLMPKEPSVSVMSTNTGYPGAAGVEDLGQQGYVMSPLSPPTHTAPPQSHGSGGYVPVTGQYYGA